MKRQFILAGGIFLLCTWPALADQPAPKKVTNFNSIRFENWIGLSNATLKVAGPDGKVTTLFEASRAPEFRLSGNRILDGVYRFELNAATDERVPNDSDGPVPNGEDPPKTVAKPFHLTGGFLVENGAIVMLSGNGDEDESEE